MMRLLVVSIWIFINLIFFGMCGYMYLLWSQYLLFTDNDSKISTITYDQQIYYYNRGYLLNATSVSTNTTRIRKKHSLKENATITYIKNSRPRFPNIQNKNIELDTKKYMCWGNDSQTECLRKCRDFEEKILKEFQRILDDESNILRIGKANRYNVEYSRGGRGNYLDQTPKQLLCELKKHYQLKTLKRGDITGNHSIVNHLPKRNFYENKRFKTCAIVTSAGALKDSNLGDRINRYDLVLRFNNAPIKNYESDIGGTTTVRLLNSQVVTKQQYDFLEADLYKNTTIIMWDPSNYNSSLSDWLNTPEFNLFPNYVAYKRKYKRSKIFIINPKTIWNLWDFLQSNTRNRLRRNPPSSGFLGLNLLLPICTTIDMFEYVPSVRATKRCHYYELDDNPACTFGVWHPLSAEKLLTYHLNTANLTTVFQYGYIRISGFPQLNC